MPPHCAILTCACVINLVRKYLKSKALKNSIVLFLSLLNFVQVFSILYLSENYSFPAHALCSSELSPCIICLTLRGCSWDISIILWLRFPATYSMEKYSVMVCLFNFLALSGYLIVCEFRLLKPACVKKNILIPRSEKSTGFCFVLYWKPKFSTLGHQTPSINLICHETNLKLHSTDHTDRELIIYSEGGKETSFVFPTCLPRLCSEAKLDEKESRVLSLYNFG